ncbi:MAG: Nif3-like dinuclear metal center hexameric protein [bacterium]
MSVTLGQVAALLDRELRIADFKDSSNNGLQVENSGTVRRICCGVDASMEFFEEAAARKADLLICHHGLSWGDSLKRITGLNYKRLAFLLANDMALYAAHLPLDAHPRLGNNALICRALGLKKVRPFGLYGDRRIGFAGELPKPMAYGAFKALVGRVTGGRNLQSMDFGRKTVRSVGVVSGGAADEIAEAGEAGLDVYLSGEPKLSAYHLAREYGINAIFAGHYATEVFGVRALGAMLASRFKVEAGFIDLGIGF